MYGQIDRSQVDRLIHNIHVYVYIIYVYKYIYKAYLKKCRHPGNWLPSLMGQKRRKAAKNDVKLKKQHKIKGKIRLNCKCNFLVVVVIEIFPGMI